MPLAALTTQCDANGPSGGMLNLGACTTDVVKAMAAEPRGAPMRWNDREWCLGAQEDQSFDENGNIGPTIWVVGGYEQ